MDNPCDILYIFPHPDDESFGPASAMHAQLRAGHRVHLLTLTRGGATKVRLELGLSVEEMGDVRAKEMDEVAKVIGLSSFTLWDLPDSGLGEMPESELVGMLVEHFMQTEPDVVVTYADHGISGFPDHIVSHRVVKKAFQEARAQGCRALARLAYFTISEQTHQRMQPTKFELRYSVDELVQVLVEVNKEDARCMDRALDCYHSYQGVIEATGVRRLCDVPVAFELEGERFDSPLNDLCACLPIHAR